MVDKTAPLHVVAAVIFNERNEVLLAQRRPDQHLAGCWEFPGGKVAVGETAEQALRRELNEELGVEVVAAQPLIKVQHHYESHVVLLDVWRVDLYQGHVRGCEGQAICWQSVASLSTLTLAPADLPVIKALKLPKYYAITEEPEDSLADFLVRQERKMRAGVKLMQFRAKCLGADDYIHYAQALIALSRRHGVAVMLNSEPAVASSLGAAGVHLTQQRLMAMSHIDSSGDFLVAASCHDAASLQHAETLGLDFVVLSPVKVTASHPAASPIGWSNFEHLVASINLPVYALGGMASDDLGDAINRGAQGIAGIRLFQD